MSTHTPGPWRIHHATSDGIDVEATSGPVACMCYYPDGRHEANARLIAAAPDLFMALRDTYNSLADLHDGYPERELGRPIHDTLADTLKTLRACGVTVDEIPDREAQ